MTDQLKILEEEKKLRNELVEKLKDVKVWRAQVVIEYTGNTMTARMCVVLERFPTSLYTTILLLYHYSLRFEEYEQ